MLKWADVWPVTVRILCLEVRRLEEHCGWKKEEVTGKWDGCVLFEGPHSVYWLPGFVTVLEEV